MWHAEEISVTRLIALRFVRPPGHPSDKSPPDAVVMADIRGEEAFLFCAKSSPVLSTAEWRSLGPLLIEGYGVKKVTAHRKRGDLGIELG